MLSVNMALSQYFRHTHTWTLSQLAPTGPGYKFGVLFVGKQKYSEQEYYPLINGDIDPSGTLYAQILHQPWPFFRTKFVAQVATLLHYQSLCLTAI